MSPVSGIYGNGLDFDPEPTILGLGNRDIGDAGRVSLVTDDDGFAKSHGEDVGRISGRDEDSTSLRGIIIKREAYL